MEQLYPEFEGKIRRDVQDLESTTYFHRNMTCIIGPTSLTISRRLQKRVLAHSLEAKELEGIKRFAHHIRADATAPIIVIGFRTQNRTIENLTEFCAELAKVLLAECGRAIIIFDGWNEQITAEESLVKNFIAQEKLVVRHVRRDYHRTAH